jgi:diguanylate cyclase (GGDEF)-like protein
VLVVNVDVCPGSGAAVIVWIGRVEPEEMSDHSYAPAYTPRDEADSGSWLCRDGVDRQRMFDMEERLRPVRQRAALIMTFAILAAGPWLGWWPLVFVICIMAIFALADRLMPQLARPEYVMFGAWVGSVVTIAGAVALSGRAGVSALSWLAIPVITLSTRFSIRGVVAGVIITIALALGVAYAVDAHAVLVNPVLAIVPVTLIVCIAALSTPLMQSDIQHRNDAVMDQLTGMLNRNALGARINELTQQASLTGEPVGVIIGDLDHFKNINDTRGHAVGDVVLKEVAYLLREQLRAFDLAYRLGGEEFLVLLPGAELEAAAELAGRLHGTVAEHAVAGGVSVRISIGVAASRRGEPFDYEAVFAKADAALYEAKRNGRDQVCLAGQDRALALA